ncbi:MAG: hypothetical protein D6803_07470, partial [Anaerolineae bacterium]
MNQNQPPLWFPLIFMIVGLLVMLVGVGIIPVIPESVHGPLWLLTTFGLMFLSAGLGLLAMSGEKGEDSLARHILQWIALTITIGSFSTLFLWVGFGPGEREFSGGLSLGPLSFGQSGNEMIGRCMFGGFGLFAALMALYFFVTKLWQIVDLIAR